MTLVTIKPESVQILIRKIGLFVVISLILSGYNLSFAQSGTLDTSFDPGTGANGNIMTASIHSDGKIVIGGDFFTYNGTDRKYIARLNSDGSLDTSFDPGTGASSQVYTTSMQSDGKVVIGGNFTSFDGTLRNYIARLNADGSLDASFDPGTGTKYVVYTTAVQNDGKIIVGGQFDTYNGIPRFCIARANTNGSLDASFNPGIGANATIYTAAIQSDGKIIIGGDFTSFNGTARNHVARLNANGSLDTSFAKGSGANSAVRTISIQSDGKIVIAGEFTSYNGTASNYIARLNTDGSLDTSFDPGTGAISTIWTSSIQSSGKIMIGGNFTSYNGTAINYIARLNTDGSLDTSFDQGTGPDAPIRTTSIQSDGKIIIGGIFNAYNGTARNHIARLIGTPVGIHQLVNEPKNVNIYPVPSRNTTTLQMEVELKNATLTVINSLGQAVKQIENISGKTIILNRDNLPVGVYLIRISQDNQKLIADKLIISD